MGEYLSVMLRQANLPLLGLSACAYLVAWATATSLSRRSPTLAGAESGAAAWRNTAIVVGILYFAGYTYLSLHCYYKLYCGAWDLGIFDSLFHNAARGSFFRDFRGPFDHFQPVYLVFVPLYMLIPGAKTLLVLQTFLLALAVWPLYLLAREVSRSSVIASVVALLYLLYPLVGEANLTDFHMLSASPICFFAMLLFMIRRNGLPYWVFLILTLCVKESECILVLGAGFYLISRRRYAVGSVTAAVAVAWFLASTMLFLPLITGAPFRHAARFQGYGDLVTWAVSTQLGRLTAAGYTVRIIAVSAATLLPLGFLPARRWAPFLFLLAPTLAVNFVSRSFFQNAIYGHYAITVASAALGACALSTEGLADALAGPRPSRLPPLLVVTAALMNLVLSYPANEKALYPKIHLQVEKSFNVLSFPLPVTASRRDFFRVGPHERLFFHMADAIPDGAVVVAQNNLAFPFVNRCRVKVVTFDDEEGGDFYLFDTRVNIGRISPEAFGERFARLDADASLTRFLDTRGPAGGGYVFYGRRDRWQAAFEKVLEFGRIESGGGPAGAP